MYSPTTAQDTAKSNELLVGTSASSVCFEHENASLLTNIIEHLYSCTLYIINIIIICGVYNIDYHDVVATARQRLCIFSRTNWYQFWNSFFRLGMTTIWLILIYMYTLNIYVQCSSLPFFTIFTVVWLKNVYMCMCMYIYTIFFWMHAVCILYTVS